MTIRPHRLTWKLVIHFEVVIYHGIPFSICFEIEGTKGIFPKTIWYNVLSIPRARLTKFLHHYFNKPNYNLYQTAYDSLHKSACKCNPLKRVKVSKLERELHKRIQISFRHGCTGKYCIRWRKQIWKEANCNQNDTGLLQEGPKIWTSEDQMAYEWVINHQGRTIKNPR